MPNFFEVLDPDCIVSHHPIRGFCHRGWVKWLKCKIYRFKGTYQPDSGGHTTATPADPLPHSAPEASFRPLIDLLSQTKVFQTDHVPIEDQAIDAEIQALVAGVERFYETWIKTANSGYKSYSFQTTRWGVQEISFGCPETLKHLSCATVYISLMDRSKWSCEDHGNANQILHKALDQETWGGRARNRTVHSTLEVYLGPETTRVYVCEKNSSTNRIAAWLVRLPQGSINRYLIHGVIIASRL